MKRRPHVLLLLTAALLFGAAAPPHIAPATMLVDPFVGTSTTPDGQDVIDDFPGADVPFGMVQWSPDTPSQNAGGGYEYGDHAITGLSLTHLSGPGCSVFGDFSFLPTTGAVTDPAHASQPFSHASEEAAPGWYAVTLGRPGIRTEVTVTTHTGLGRFVYPAGATANLLVNVSSDQAGVRLAGFTVVNAHEIDGYAQTGGFCGMPDRYTVYFVAQFDRPIASYGTWHGTTLTPGSTRAQGPDVGGWLTFDTAANPAVKMRVGLSFTDLDGARKNLAAEGRGWDLTTMRNAALARWQHLLDRVRVTGGTPAERRTFYTAVYHTLLHPNVYSDVDGRYRGFDDAIHHARPGHAEYANFSDWDIYRTEMPWLALIAPRESSDMVQSLVDAAGQTGMLPRWALVNGATSVMGGDSVDPVIAGAYAFGARDFDVHAALDAMVRGASDAAIAPVNGWYVERPELPEYLQRGYIVNTHTTSVSPVPNGASETLEYALDDFSIARFAQAAGAPSDAAAFMKRSSNWARLFDRGTGLITPRDAAGAFMLEPITSMGQSGFQEGNAAQYTPMVPQDLADLIKAMGGRAAAIAKLDTFFTQLNAGQDKPYAWLGNEISLGSPWVYLTAGAPWHTQQIIREALLTQFGDSPHGLTGNDDLGTMSAWYIWGAIGLYPQNPAVRDLDIGSPLFSHVTIASPGGPTIDIDAPGASDTTPYVRALRVNGATTAHTWIALPMHGSLRLDFALAASPDTSWGSAPNDAPPSFATVDTQQLYPPPTTGTFVQSPQPETIVAPGATATLAFTATSIAPAPIRFSWRAHVPAGFSMQPDRGEAAVSSGGNTPIAATVTASSSVAPGLYDVPITADACAGAACTVPRALVAVVRVQGEPLALGYIENRWDNTVTPFDPRTGAIGAPITVGDEPRDSALSRDGRYLYVADHSGAAISVVDTQAQKTVATIKVGNGPNGIALTPDGKTLWVANNGDNTIQPIDTVTRHAGAPIATGPGPRFIAIAPDGRTLYVSNQGANSVTPFDLSTMKAGVPIAVGAQPTGIAIAPDGKIAYVVNTGDNSVTPIDLERERALPAIPVGVEPMLIAIAPDGKVAYVTNYATTTVTPIDLAGGRVLAPIHVGGAPWGVAFTPDSKTAYVVARRDSALIPIDVATGRAGAPIPIGSTSPYTLAVP